MSQDVALGVTMTITQAQIPLLRETGRLGEYAVVYRAYRQQMGGGFGDQEKNPFAWGVLVYVDTQVARVYSARGLPREWSDLARLEKWMRDQGFWYWWMRNDLEPLHQDAPEDDAEGLDDASAEQGTDTKLLPDGVALDAMDATNENNAPANAPDSPSSSENSPTPTHLFTLVPNSGGQ